jgi:hypothetical protein
MKTFALAATVAAGLVFTAGSADAQFRSSYRSGSIYNTPTVTPTYNYGGYNGVNGVGYYTPLGGTSMIVPSGGYSPLYTPNYAYPSYSGYNGYNAYPSYSYNGGYSNGWYGRGRRW